MVPVGRLELPLSESKTDVLPIRRNGMVPPARVELATPGSSDLRSTGRATEAKLETVTGFEPALMELQSIAFPLGYTVIVGYMLLKRVSELASVNVDGGAGSALVPAERIELTSSASEADVLPLDEAEM